LLFKKWVLSPVNVRSVLAKFPDEVGIDEIDEERLYILEELINMFVVLLYILEDNGCKNPIEEVVYNALVEGSNVSIFKTEEVLRPSIVIEPVRLKEPDKAISYSTIPVNASIDWVT
jgi:hypothetical protein